MRHILYGGFDVTHIITDEHQIQTVRLQQIPAHLFHDLHHGIFDINDIGARLTFDSHGQATLVIDHRHFPNLIVTEINGRHIFKINIGTVAMCQDQVFQFLLVVESSYGANQITFSAIIQITGRRIAVPGANSIANLSQTQASLCQLGRIDKYLHLPFCTAAQLYFRYTGNPFHLSADIVIDKIGDHVDIKIQWISR